MRKVSPNEKEKVLFGYVDCCAICTLADSGFFKNFSTVSWVFEDLKFKISEGYYQNWSEPSEILNLRSSTTPETVAFTPP